MPCSLGSNSQIPVWVQCALIPRSSSSQSQGTARNIRIIQCAYEAYRFLGPHAWRSKITRDRALEAVFSTNKQTNKSVGVSGGQPGLITTVYSCDNHHYHCPCHCQNILINHSFLRSAYWLINIWKQWECKGYQEISTLGLLSKQLRAFKGWHI